jgi:hypothetical protein
MLSRERTGAAVSNRKKYPSYVAGLPYANEDGTSRAEYAATHAREGARLRPQLEPDNPVDPKAVALYLGAFKIGYVPERHHWIHDALCEGDFLDIAIVDVIAHGGKAEKLALKVDVMSRPPGSS